MKQEKLKREIDKILSNPDTGKYEFRYSEAMHELIQEHVAEIIGEDEKDAAVYADYTANTSHFRNELREEQRKRAGL